MKRVLAVVACGSLHLAPCQASSGWGAAAGSAAGAGGSWPSPPPNGPPQGPPADEQSNSQPPLDPANYDHPNARPAAGGEGFEAAAAANDGTAAGYHEPHAYRHDPQQQHYQKQQQQQPPPYDPSFIPQQSRWAGQHRQQQQQQQHQQQHHFPQHQGYPPASGGGGISGGPGQPLHLGTKWRNMVSRVKDAVRPGQPPSPDYGGFQAGYGGGGGWAEGGGGGGGGYPPPGSSWVGATNHNERYNLPQGVHSGQAHPSANSGYDADYGQQQQQQPYGGGGAQQAAAAAADYGGYPPGGSDGAAAGFGHQGQQQHHAAPPQTYFDGADAFAQPPGPPPEETQAQSQAPPDLYAESNVDGSSSSSSSSSSSNNSSGHGFKTGSTEGYGAGSGGGDQHAGMVGTATMSEGQRVAVGGGLPAREPSFEPQQPAAPSAVGQGWSTPSTGSAPAATSHQAPAAASGGSGHGNGAAMAAVSNDSAWTPQGGQGGGVQDGDPKMAASGPPAGGAALATPFESRVEQHGSAAAGEFSGSASFRANQGTSSLDTMPTSADHGMEKVDWGKGAEEAEGEGGTGAGEGESGETVVVPGSEERLELEREEEALIRELERMDSSIENGDSLPGAGGAGVGVGASGISSSSSSGSSSLLSSAAPLEDQAMIDEAVEHQLDDIFDSIILDEEIDVDVDFEVDVDADSADVAAAAAEGRGYTSVAHERPRESVVGGDWGLFDEGTADVAQEDQPAEPWQGTQTAPADLARTPGGLKPRAHEGDAPPEGAPAASSPWGAAATACAEGAPMPTSTLPSSAAAEAAAAAAAATAPEAEAVGGGSGSLWGSTDRWDSLPPQPEADISDSEEEEHEEEHEEEQDEERAEQVQRVVEEDVQELDGVDDDDDDDDDDGEADVRVLLDPIELPPSAATDEIWNDQHLQDQLDAYWEQSRRGGAAAAGVGAGPPPTGVQQLSAYGSGEPHLQPTYGPGDWVGGGGGGALLPEPLPGAAAPRLFQGGNQAPINIYGNVHVHLQQGGADQQQQQQGGGASAELSARERYYSQGETSWSGSERGGQ